jgi:hypothetical protein
LAGFGPIRPNQYTIKKKRKLFAITPSVLKITNDLEEILPEMPLSQSVCLQQFSSWRWHFFLHRFWRINRNFLSSSSSSVSIDESSDNCSLLLLPLAAVNLNSQSEG